MTAQLGTLEPAVTNHATDPVCTKPRSVWRATITKVGSYYKYEREDVTLSGSVHVWGELWRQPLLQVEGTMLYAAIEFDNPTDAYSLEGVSLVWDSDNGAGRHLILARTGSNPQQNKTIGIRPNMPWTLLETGIYRLRRKTPAS